MFTAAEILQSPDYTSANAATKQAIFDKHVASSPDFSGANAATQAAIRQRFGLSVPQAEEDKSMLAGAAAGAVPYAGAMGTGALIGGSIGALIGGPPGALAGAGIGARAAPVVLGVADIGTSLYNTLAQRLGYGAVPTPSETFIRAGENLGIGVNAEPITKAVVGGALGGYTGARGLQGMAPYFTTPVAQGVVNTMAAQAPLQGLAGGAGGLAVGGLQEAGVTNPIALTAGSVAGGAAVPASLATANLGTRGTNALVNRFGILTDPLAATRVQTAEGRGPQIVEALRGTPVSETGAALTGAQASVGANAPAYTAMLEQASRLLPAQAYEMAVAQRAARAGTLERGAGTPEERAALVKERSEAAAPLYEAARAPGNVADIAPAQQIVQTLMNENPGNRALMRELRAINRNMFETDPEGGVALRTDARQIGSIIDDLKTAISKEDNRFIKGQLTQVRDALVESVPNLPEARAVFRKMSTPINQREGFVFLKEKLESPLMDEGERPGVFGGAVKALTSERDAPAALRRAITDMPRYKSLDELYPPEQVQMIDAVRLDLARDAKLRELVQRGRETIPDVTKIAKEGGVGESLPNPLNQTIAIANRILGKMQGQLDRKLAMELAMESLNPQVAAKALERSLARQAQLERFRLTAPQMMGREAYFTSQLPAFTNAFNPQENRNSMAR